MDIEYLNEVLNEYDIFVLDIHTHDKASENYVEVVINGDNDHVWEGIIPYYYRRAGILIETDEELIDYLISIKPYFCIDHIESWIAVEKYIWETEHSGKKVTKAFFEELCKMCWTNNFPDNDNPARRIQEIKDMGYTISTRRIGNKTERLLLPIPKHSSTGYEMVTPKLKKRVTDVLNGINVYELSNSNKSGMVADHKFPEIRWDSFTKSEDIENMSDEEIRKKFQLIDNQRNQQKREECRKCFQTGIRGTPFGIDFYYKGNREWPSNVPKIGVEAEKGCKGCGWYDIEKWRSKLNKKIKKIKCEK